MHSPLTTTLTLLTTSTLLATLVHSTADLPVHLALSTLPLDPAGFTHVADDGVARAYDGNRNIIAFVPLTNAQLMEYISSLSPSADKAHFHDVYDTIDGYDVSGDQLTNPGLGFRPPAVAGTATTKRERGDAVLRRDPPEASCESEICTTNRGCIEYEDLDCSGCNFLDLSDEGRCVTRATATAISRARY